MAAEAQPALKPRVVPRALVQAPVDRIERWRTNDRWGDLQPSTMAGVLRRGKEGDVADLVDLCEFVIDSDALISSLYDSRITRVLQSDFAIVPNPFGDQAIAKMASDLVNECVQRIPDWHQVQRDLLHAIAVGFSCGENEWSNEQESRAANLNWVKRIDFRHGHRFRYDEVWQLRLYDQGMRRGDGSIYGEALEPHKWTIHQHRVLAGYPGIGGVMRACLWWWLFGRMGERWWLGSTERNQQPFWRAKVPKNTPESVRARIRGWLEDLSADHVAVVEEGVDIIVDAAAAAAKSHEGYEAFLARAEKVITLAWLGMTDATTSGVNGARSATETRAGAMLDPRMLADGLAFGASLQSTLFTSLIACNAHRFPVPVSQVPVPLYRYAQLTKTEDVQSQALNGAQMDALSALVEKVKAGTVPRSSALALAHMALPTATEEQIQKLIPPEPASSPLLTPGAAPPAPPALPRPPAAEARPPAL